MHYKNWNNNHKLFLIENAREYDYNSLYQEVSLIQAHLTKYFLPGTSFILEAQNSFNSYARFLAILGNGHRVLLCPSSQFKDQTYLNKLIEEAGSPFVLWSKSMDVPKESIEVHSEKADSDELWKSSRFIVRTSGSSGEKFKLVLHNTELFYQKYKKIGPHFTRTYAFSPAESIAGIETLLEVLTNELTLVSGLDDLTPSKVVALLGTHQVDYFQTTPTYMNLMVISGLVSQEQMSGLKKIAYGSEPTQKFVVDYFKQQLPGLELMHTYGMSEIGIQKTITNQDDPSLFTLDEEYNRFKIENGLLEVESMTKMIRYLNEQETPSSAGPGWFQTNDEVTISDHFIKVLGRRGDLINIAGRKFFPSELEDLIRHLPEVSDVTVSTEKNEMVGTVVVANIVIRPEIDELEFRMLFKIFCQEKILNYMHPHKIKIKRDVEILPRLKKMRNK